MPGSKTSLLRKAVLFRISKAKLNIISTMASQIVTIICGLVVPRLLLGAFGSAQYGLTVSITQFLSFVALFEGGIGGVARARLYDPLAHGNEKEISAVFRAEQEFFRHLGLAFILYSIILGLFFRNIAHADEYSGPYLFALVMAISLSSIAKYMFGLPNLTIILADQRKYVNSMIMIATTIINMIAVMVLVNRSLDILWVKLGSSLVFIARPVIYSLYTRKHYNIQKTEKAVLEQKWTGIGQHIAYYLHMNADIILLTVFADIKWVAVYSVYSLIITNIRALTESFSGSMEAAFGELIAKKQQNRLVRSYKKYTGLITAVTVVLFSCTGILILDFVRLYTKGVNDADYFQPAFAMILLAAESVNCLSLTSSSMPIAANQIKQTRWGAYGEALINITVSLSLIHWNPLVGVALGTLAATVFRGIYYVIYASGRVLHLPVYRQVIHLVCYSGVIMILTAIGYKVVARLSIDNFLQWCICGVLVFIVISVPASLLLKSYLKRIDEQNKGQKEDPDNQ